MFELSRHILNENIKWVKSEFLKKTFRFYTCVFLSLRIQRHLHVEQSLCNTLTFNVLF